MYACPKRAARVPSSFVGRSGSQSERISILKMALSDKGIVAGSHYDFVPPHAQMTDAERPAERPVNENAIDENGGVDL
jgi:hypothetical protein